jgi:hypothetical protein
MSQTSSDGPDTTTLSVTLSSKNTSDELVPLKIEVLNNTYPSELVKLTVSSQSEDTLPVSTENSMELPVLRKSISELGASAVSSAPRTGSVSYSSS